MTEPLFRDDQPPTAYRGMLLVNAKPIRPKQVLTAIYHSPEAATAALNRLRAKYKAVGICRDYGVFAVYKTYGYWS